MKEHLTENHNDQLSRLKGLELQELLKTINNSALELRKTLGIDKSYTFGLEIESENAKFTKIEEQIKMKCLSKDWKTEVDGSLEKGVEINSPILHDEEKTWIELVQICEILKQNSKIGPNSAGHVHIGTQVLGDNRESWQNLFLLWSTYENIIFRFTNGEYIVNRPKIFKYAKPLRSELSELYEECEYNERNIYEMLEYIRLNRNQAINFGNVCDTTEFIERNTLEFRSPNGTINPVIWQNNVNFLIHILEAVKKSTFAKDTVEKQQIANRSLPDKFQNYNAINIKQMLDLSDIIFTNNLDKLYFIRQYLKSFVETGKPLKKAPRFTK